MAESRSDNSPKIRVTPDGVQGGYGIQFPGLLPGAILRRGGAAKCGTPLGCFNCLWSIVDGHHPYTLYHIP